ncbi:DUF5695 domain-containing protein [Aliifodinibius salicampi]|uniref:DUF5695 domain-containing protein n=1 Tax=Fodinibius salicampi TaxID=1920655 RepID=A0ABT3PUT1_9BACT|nr:DUF5695 domain-containing protein [Fodinibius salicampi]MCW9711583.1 DUF5695 domain-containing protein [Fodinibius salicampi]
MKSFRKKVLPALPVFLYALLLILCVSLEVSAQNDETDNITPTLGLEQGYLDFEIPNFRLKLVKASQTIAALEPKGEGGFDFTPADWLERRNGDGYYHLGDLTLRLRTGKSGEWTRYSTADKRAPVKALESSSFLAGALLNPTLDEDIPLQVRRYWQVKEGNLVLRFELENTGNEAVEVGGLGIPMVFNNILHERDLEEAHAKCSFYDPYIGQDAGYLQVTRLNGQGPALIVAPDKNKSTSFESYKPLLADSTQKGITFEGFHEWMVHTEAYEQNEWKDADNWNETTSAVIVPGESRSYGIKFLLSDTIRDIEETLVENEHPVAKGMPGYVLPQDQEGQLFLKYTQDIASVSVEPEGLLQINRSGTTQNGWNRIKINGEEWGRARLTVTYQDGVKQSVHYKVIKPESEVVDDMGDFLTTEQWFDEQNDPFNRAPSVISYDYGKKEQVRQDNRAWIAGLSDEGGAGSWLAAVMKQLVDPDREEIKKLEAFVDNTLWGGIQYSEGEQKYGVRKSMFYYEPDEMPEGTYSEDVNFGGWSSWSKEEARSVGRSYNYPHVAAAYWVLYRLARNHEGLVTNHPWDWYLERAYETSEAMVEYAPHYAQYGQMEGTVFLLILKDLQREGWEQAASLEETMRERAELWESLPFPFGSEMPWDSTGQEEVYAWCKYFGFDQKARVTLNAILGYMPTVPHWGYNGSARRYWDFLYAGKLSRIERQLHHYGSGLNAIPVLTEYRENPEDYHLLRVGYGGLMGSIANVTQDGFGPAAFHSFPSTLAIDGYSGDYGSGFFGHAVNTGTYVIDHPEFGWQTFGGNLEHSENWITVEPLNSARSRFYLAPMGLWLTLDAGKFDKIRFNPDTKEVQLVFEEENEFTKEARLRINQPAKKEIVGTFKPQTEWEKERGAFVIPLGKANNKVNLDSN